MFVNNATRRNGSVTVMSWKRYTLWPVRVCLGQRRVSRNRARRKNMWRRLRSMANIMWTGYLYTLTNLHNLFLPIHKNQPSFHPTNTNNPPNHITLKNSTLPLTALRSLNSTKFSRSITTANYVILVTSIFRIVVIGFVKPVRRKGDCISCVKSVMITNYTSIPKIIGWGWIFSRWKRIFLMMGAFLTMWRRIHVRRRSLSISRRNQISRRTSNNRLPSLLSSNPTQSLALPQHQPWRC